MMGESACLGKGDDKGEGVDCNPFVDGLGLRHGVHGKDDIISACDLHSRVTGQTQIVVGVYDEVEGAIVSVIGE
jgi:hypothetical protein